jgi:hypothetical protein
MSEEARLEPAAFGFGVTPLGMPETVLMQGCALSVRSGYVRSGESRTLLSACGSPCVSSRVQLSVETATGGVAI